MTEVVYVVVLDCYTQVPQHGSLYLDNYCLKSQLCFDCKGQLMCPYEVQLIFTIFFHERRAKSSDTCHCSPLYFLLAFRECLLELDSWW